MPSPFPGMDPFLETRWSNFHSMFAAMAAAALNPRLPPGFVARVETDLYIHEPSAEERGLAGGPPRRRFAAADWSIKLTGVAGERAPRSGTAAATRPTAVGAVPGGVEERTRRVEVRDADGGRVVTAVELLSPTNKVRHRDAYLQKREAVLVSPTHLVEIDLLRAGSRLPVEGDPGTSYLVTVSVAERRPAAGLWGFGLRDPLPAIPVPLDDGDAVALDLRAVCDAVYDASGYARDLYDRPPDPPLDPDDAAWAAEILTAAGLLPPPDFPPAGRAASSIQ